MSNDYERLHGRYDQGMWSYQKALDETIAQIPLGSDNLEKGKVPKWRCRACPVGGCSAQIWQKHRCVSFLSYHDCLERVAYHIVNCGRDDHTCDPDAAWDIAVRTADIDLYWIERSERNQYAEPPSPPPSEDARKPPGKSKRTSRSSGEPPPVKKEKKGSTHAKEMRRKDERMDDRKDPKEKDERKADRKHPRHVSKDEHVRTPDGASSCDDTETVHCQEESSSSRPKRILTDSASSSNLALRTKNAAAAADDHMLMNRAQIMAIADSLTRAAKACRSAEQVCRTAQDAFRQEADNIIDSRDDMLSMMNRFRNN